MVREIKTEIPRLLGFESCEIFMGNKKANHLYTFSVAKDEKVDTNEVFSGIKMKHIEEEYNIPMRKIVSMPDDLGYSGFAYTKNCVCFINDLTNKLNFSLPCPVVTAYG